MQKLSPKILVQALYEATQGQSAVESAITVKTFVEYVVKKRMIGRADEIIEKYRKLVLKEEGIVEAEVTTSHPLAHEAEGNIKKFVKQEFEAKEVHISYKLEESLLGGMKLKIGDTIIDGTLKGRLTQLQRELTK
jgi:F-type H+-transporting ATPase subunit delta